ncbi:MAG: hypothetical protein Q8926_00600 [Bacteroidota bacterium]|nr:hypothetical protein [Bacteroidota bacterium]
MKCKKLCKPKSFRMILPVTGLLLLGFNGTGYSQTEVEPWGNIIGIRVNGQPMAFETSLRVVSKDWSYIKSTGQEKQRPKYKRSGNQQIVTTAIDSFHFTEVIEEAGKGSAKINIQVRATTKENANQVFFNLSLPYEYYANGKLQVDHENPVSLAGADSGAAARPVMHAVRFVSRLRQLEVLFTEPGSVFIKRETSKGISRTQIYIPIPVQHLPDEQTVSKTFVLKASGEIDRMPVTLRLDTLVTGRAFKGFGGNFRLQNAKADPQVIDYCLENLRLAWGRVEMPWLFWQPDINENPIEEARAGRLNSRVQKAMEMAQRLNKMGIPIVLTAWSAPTWAIVGTPHFRPGADGVWGNPLDHTKEAEIYKSIADYIDYLKEQYGVEVRLFSFNESDLGINIRQTGEEHAALIRGLGAYLVSRGLKTKMLLGDNSDATTYSFIYPAMNDPAAYPYIGAISFHSWRGWETEILEKWAEAAAKMRLPLLVGEGSIDAAAWNYPDIFGEPLYAMEEINLYTRLLAICQPESILQWQLTADYSPLAGGGIFGHEEPLHPTQRFWNLKQLSSTPENLKAMAITSDRPLISCAALGDNQTGLYTLHLVNNGTTRKVNLYGLPDRIKTLRIYTTDEKRNMQEGRQIPVKKGRARFTLDSYAYTTLMSK